MVKIRLKRIGSKFNAFYRIVVADSRAPRDGKYIEELGFYNPHTKEFRLDVEARDKWLSEGAVPSETVKRLFSKAEKKGLNSNELVVLPIKEKKVKKEEVVIETPAEDANSEKSVEEVVDLEEKTEE